MAAPVFHDIMTYALQELGIPPTGTTLTPFPLKVSEAAARSNPHMLRDGQPAAGR